MVTVGDRRPPLRKAQSENKMAYFQSQASRVRFETFSAADEDPADLKPVAIDGIRGVRIHGTADDFCHTLEQRLDRLVVNETNLQGKFEFDVESGAGAINDFFQLLHDQTGVLIFGSAKRTGTGVPASPRFDQSRLGLRLATFIRIPPD
jgi:hypothetical protein